MCYIICIYLLELAIQEFWDFKATLSVGNLRKSTSKYFCVKLICLFISYAIIKQVRLGAEQALVSRVNMFWAKGTNHSAGESEAPLLS